MKPEEYLLLKSRVFCELRIFKLRVFCELPSTVTIFTGKTLVIKGRSTTEETGELKGYEVRKRMEQK